MKYGLPDTIIQVIRKTLSSFSVIEKAILYGSRAKGSQKQGSDIDLCLFGNIDLTMRYTIEIALEDLDLPYFFDICIYRDLKNEDLIAHIDRVGILFFEK